MIICHCGGVSESHEVGSGNCYRYHVTDSDEIPRNRRQWYRPEYWPEPVWVWDVGDGWVTENDLFNNRLYHSDENGNWTAPKKNTLTSLDVDEDEDGW